MEIDFTGDAPIPLYIGKASDIFSRYCRHLMIKKSRLLPVGILEIMQLERESGRKYNTSVQLRDRIDRMFPDVDDTLGLILENVGFSYVLCDDEYCTTPALCLR